MSNPVQSSVLSLLAPVPAPGSTGLPTRSAAALREDSFSRQLQQVREARSRDADRAPRPQDRLPEARPPAPSPAAPPRQSPSQSETQNRIDAARQARARAERKDDTTRPASAAAPERSPESDKPRKAESDDKAATPAPGSTADAATQPTPPAGVAAGSATGPTEGDPLSGGATDLVTDIDSTDQAGPHRPRTGTTPNGAAARAAAGNDPSNTTALAASAAARATDGSVGTWQQAQAAALLAGKEGTGRASLATETPLPMDRAQALSSAAGPAGTPMSTVKAGELAHASLSTPATSAEFRAALGTQVSIFARAGVQQAELHLNPAEMGPVSIRIVLDGQEAQVNFGADSALTRQIIESGMPELASALREAGLTLTGGGVSQHAGGQRREGDANGNANGAAGSTDDRHRTGAAADASGDAAGGGSPRGSVAGVAGGLDLYA